MANYIVTTEQLTVTAEAIRNKTGNTATMVWDSNKGFADSISAISTGIQLYATVTVSYPAGSICTLTNGIKTYTASNTNGSYTFSVPMPSTNETWTVSCTNSVNSDSKNILLKTYECNNNVILSYADPILNNNSWETISLMARNGIGDEYWDIGDRKAITLNGKIGSYNTISNYTLYIFILDFNHPINKTTADNNIIFGGFKTALTGGVDACIHDSGYNNSQTSGVYFNLNHRQVNTTVGNTNYGGWAGSDFRYDILGTTSTAPSSYNTTSKSTGTIGYNAIQTTISSPKANTLMATLPSDFRNVLRLWTRYVDNKGNKSNVDANITAIVDGGISLLTEYEIFGARSWANQYEQNHQKQMAYYIAGNSTIKYNYDSGNITMNWWTCSSDYSSNQHYCMVQPAGAEYSRISNYSYGIAPIFKV